MKIRLIKSSFYNEQDTKDKLCDFIKKSVIVSFSQYCKQFEEDYATWQWRTYCSFVNSGSSANLALIQALLNLWRLKKWDKVAFSSLSWATNVMPLMQLGLTPIPVDVETDTLNVSLSKFKKVCQEHDIKSLFITNLLGFCDDLDEIETYCSENNIILLEDNCESMWSVYKWRKLGNYSLASTFSTFVGHHMSTIEGGMICTDDKELYVMLGMVRAHGWDRNLSPELQKEIRTQHNTENSFYSQYTFYTSGFNLRPNEINGFIWCTQIPYLDEIVEKRVQNFHKFVKIINSNPDFYDLKHEHLDTLSNFAIPLICKSSEILEKYIEKFEKAGVEIRPIVGWDLTRQLFWTNTYGENPEDTNAKMIHTQWFYFGNSPEYTQEEMDILCWLIK